MKTTQPAVRTVRCPSGTAAFSRDGLVVTKVQVACALLQGHDGPHWNEQLKVHFP